MPLPLSYPGLQCVLEHLEAVKRAHIIGRSPGLQKIERLIPLSLESFHIRNNKVITNRFCIKCEKDEVKFEMNLKTYSRKESASQEDKMKKLFNFYICGRSIINVDSLHWGHRLLPDFLPADLKFRVNSFDAPCRVDFETAIPFIDPRSFPLRTASTILNISIFDNQFTTSAETLILRLFSGRAVTLDHLKKFNNKTVAFERFTDSKFDMVSLVKYHVETKKDIRTTFVISNRYKGFINDMIREFELAFGKYKSVLDGVNERFIPGSSKFSIPINNESRIQVYATEDPKEGFYKEEFPYNTIVKSISDKKDVIGEVSREFEQAFGDLRRISSDVNKSQILPGSFRFSIPITRINVYATKKSKNGPYKIIVKPVSGL